jgi:modulator of FtsH protease HflC
LPGLHWRVPGIDEIKRFDARIHTMETTSERFITIEKKDVIVDAYVKWRIADVAQYFRATGGNQDRADQLLKERINTSLRDEFGRRTIQDVVSGERSEIMTKLTKEASEQAGDLGITIVDVRVKQIDLPPEVSESVYDRMRAERERVARDLRAQGGEQSERIRADADRQRTVILAEAYKEAEQLRGEGDARAADIYATAFGQNPEFYDFYRSLAAYRNVFQRGNDTLVLKPDSEFFRYFGNQRGE